MTSLEVKKANMETNMETRKCRYCNGAIPADKRADTKFCSNSCKANFWEQNKEKKKIPDVKVIPLKEKPKAAEQPLEGLRGVIENKPKTDVRDVKKTSDAIEKPIETKVETEAYKDAFAKMKEAEAGYQRVCNLLAVCEKNIRDWQGEDGRLQSINPTKKYIPINIDAQALFERCGNEFSKVDKEKERQIAMQRQNAHTEIKKANDNKNKLNSMYLPQAKRQLEEAERKLKSVPQYKTVKPLFTAAPDISGGKTDVLDVKKPSETSETRLSELSDAQHENNCNEQNSAPIQTSSKLISSRELREINYRCLNFQGKWKEFFGLPAVVFHLAVHGKPGEGKSTFCIQFADYLAKNFGHVVYISGEEGFSKTLQAKIINNKIDNPYLFFADISSYGQITNEIENNKFHFIFIDSLDNLKIDAARMRELREHYPQSAFITISQSTKDGKMRGSQEITHDCDIALKVEDGVAVTTKNRYEERGREFQVFTTSGKPAKKMIEEPRNLI